MAETPYRDPDPFACRAQGLTLDFYPGGADRLDALLALIGDARETLRMCFYIFAADGCRRRVRDALVEAAERGVAVTLLIDGFGSSDTPDSFFDGLVAAGAEVIRFIARLTRRYLIRNHQKIAIADERVAMIGGFNIADGYFAPPEENGWHDLALRLRGPAVPALARWLDSLHDWARRPDAQWRAIRRLVREWDPGTGPVRWLIGGPTARLSPWARCVGIDLVEGRRLDMMMAYFSPARRLLRRIGRIAAKGEARLVLAGKSDNNATIGATRSLYGALLKRGARVWEFAPCKLHAKLIVLDDAVYLGSANFDMRSLYLNLELMLRIEDAALADRMRAYVAAHLPASIEVTPETHRAQATLWNRFRWNISWFLVTVVDYTVSRRLNLGL